MTGTAGTFAEVSSECVRMLNTEPAAPPRHTKRETWSSRLDYLLACVGCAVGVGNVWRFPYLCFRNGGGAFLLPYMVCVLIIGIPVLFLETALGQYTRRGVVGVWTICPLVKGLGLCMALYGLLTSVYYNIIITWIAYYFTMSFWSELPWAQCGHTWNSNSCLATDSPVTSEAVNITVLVNMSLDTNISRAETTNGSGVDPATEFWWNGVLELSGGVGEPGGVRLHLLASLAVVWVISYFCTWRGVRWSGKVVYVTATLPYVLLLALLVYAARLPGAGYGVTYYLQPRFHQLANPHVWFEAASQVLFSYSVALGIWQAYGSYCPFNSNCYRGVLLVSVINSLTSFLSGFVVFTMLGHMAHTLHQPIDSVATSGPGLAFVVYPRALAQLHVPQLWSALFFFMMFLVCIDSQVGLLEGVMTTVIDTVPRWSKHRPWALALYSVLAFLLGISMITQGGMYVFQLVDYYLFGAFVPQVLCLLEVGAVAFLYGTERLYDNISSMIGYRINPWMKVSWLVLTPLSLVVIMAFQIATFKPLIYNKSYTYPGWANTLGYVLTACVLVVIPVYAVFALAKTQGGILQRLRETTKPTTSDLTKPELMLTPDPDVHIPLHRV